MTAFIDLKNKQERTFFKTQNFENPRGHSKTQTTLANYTRRTQVRVGFGTGSLLNVEGIGFFDFFLDQPRRPLVFLFYLWYTFPHYGLIFFYGHA
jgi:hypothetical protein